MALLRKNIPQNYNLKLSRSSDLCFPEFLLCLKKVLRAY